jgi:phage terminase large subunit
LSSRTLRIETAAVFEPLLGNQRFAGAKGGRGSGKSWFFGGRTIEECIDQHIRCACLRETQNSLEDSVKPLLESFIHKYGLDDLFVITDREIRGPNESLFIFKGIQNHTASRFKSAEGFNRGLFDEAQELSQKSMDLAIPTFRAQGSILRFGWNPTAPSDPVDRMFRENADDPNFVCVTANYSDNPWFPDDLRGDMERDKRRDPEKYAHVWLGKYRKLSEARVFRNWRVGKMEVPKGCRPYFGCDWGFAVDPTVIVRLYLIGERTIYINAESWAVGCEIDRTPALFDKIDGGMARLWPCVGDSSNPQAISYMRRHGYPKLIAAKKGPGSVEEGVEFMKSYDIVVDPDACPHVVDELSSYSYEIDKRTDEVLPILEDKKNHTIDACRYALEPLRRAAPVATFGWQRTA